jgi:hypothetical protein
MGCLGRIILILVVVAIIVVVVLFVHGNLHITGS